MHQRGGAICFALSLTTLEGCTATVLPQEMLSQAPRWKAARDDYLLATGIGGQHDRCTRTSCQSL